MDYKLHYPTSKSEFVKAGFFAIFQSKNLPDRGKIIVEWQKRSYIANSSNIATLWMCLLYSIFQLL